MGRAIRKAFSIVKTEFKVDVLDFDRMLEGEHGLVFEKGAISLKGLVPMHTHVTSEGTHYEEIYKLLDDGKEQDVRILILPMEEWESISTSEIKERLIAEPQMIPGKEYICPVEWGHAVANVRGWLQNHKDYPIIENVKYYPYSI